MSNTDGEDTQKVSLGELLLNAGTRIVDLEKQSNDQVEIITHLEKQLASLREQLKIYERLSEDQDSTIMYLNEQLKQKEDENLELVERLESHLYLFDEHGQMRHELELFIQKHKKNLSA